MAAPRDPRLHRRLIAILAGLLPRAQRDDWRREWEAELDHHEHELRTWRVPHLERRLLVRSAGAIRDVVWLQRRRFEEFVQDIRFGLRLLARSPGFTAAALLSLAIGIGASTAVFTLINAALFRPLPYPGADRLVAVRTDESQHFSVPGFVDLAAHAQALDHLAAFETLTFVLGDGRPEQVRGQLVSQEFSDLVGLSGPLWPIAGRAFTSDDFTPGRNRVALVSHQLWTRRYGASTDLVGRTISIDAAPTTAIGVLPPQFDFFATSDLVQPLTLSGPRLNERFYRSLEVVGRLKPGAMVSQAAAQLAAGVEAVPGERAPAIRLELVRDLLVRDFRRTLFTMWAVAGLVLLIGGCNFANLLLARTMSRAHELAVRTALGAGRGRITRQLAAER
jgi:putative ABC transport system permease protein